MCDGEIRTDHTFDRVDDLQNRVALAVAAIENLRDAAFTQIVQGLAMSSDEIAHVNVIPDASTIVGWIVVAENFHRWPFAESSLDGNFDKVGRFNV